MEETGIIGYVAEFGVEVIAMALTGVAIYVGRFVSRYLGAEAGRAAEDTLMAVSERAVAYAEEKAAQYALMADEKVDGNFKLDLAFKFIDATITPTIKKQYGPKWKAVAQAHIEGALGVTKGAGATQEATFTPVEIR